MGDEEKAVNTETIEEKTAGGTADPMAEESAPESAAGTGTADAVSGESDTADGKDVKEASSAEEENAEEAPPAEEEKAEEASAAEEETAEEKLAEEAPSAEEENVEEAPAAEEEKAEEKLAEEAPAAEEENAEEIPAAEAAKAEEPAAPKKRKRGKVIKILLLLLVAAGLIAAASFYGYYVWYYTDHFYQGTTVNGIDVSDLTEAEAAQLLQENMDQWELTVYERDGVTETIDAQDIDLTYTDDGSLDELYVVQQPLLWGIRVFRENIYEVPSEFEYNEELLQSLFENFRQVKSFVSMKNAEIVKNEDGTYRIEPEVVGTEMDQEAAYEALAAAVESQKTELDLEEYYLSPEVYEEDLEEELEEKNAIAILTRAVIYIQFGDEQLTLDEDTLTGWMVKDKNGDYSIDETQLREFVQGLYDTYNVGHENQLFKTKNGRVIMDLETFEEEGWNIDVDLTCERYLQAIQEGYQGVLGPVMTRTDDSGNILTDTYVEISLDEQTMWLIVDGEVVLETPVVTGGADTTDVEEVTKEYLMSSFENRATPSNGIWTIKKKVTPHLMKGNMLANGQYEYTLQVTYWMPFNDTVGIHDNYQRVDYGGVIYQTMGSHGCINTPYEAVEEIFNTVEVGTMVVVYGSDDAEEVYADYPDVIINTEASDTDESGTQEALSD